LKYCRLQTLLAALSIGLVLPACVPLIVAGVGTTVATSTADRRSYGIQVQDNEIELRFNHTFPATLEARTHASATSYNRWLLLTGQAIDPAAKAEVEEVARRVPNVREVINELSIGYPPSFSTRSNDVLLTTTVKARLMNNKDISASHFKVVTESGTVYLLGIVTAEEGNLATEIARTTSGVERVVRVFETMTAEEIARLTSSTPAPVSTRPPAEAAKP